MIIYRKFAFLFIFALLALPLFTLAGNGIDAGGKTPPLTSIEIPNALGKGTTIFGLFNKVLDALKVIVGAAAAAMIVYSAFQILTSGGDPTKFSNARKTILYAVIGLSVFLLADLIVGVVTEFLGKE